MPNAHVLYVSYRGHLEWFQYSFRSFKKYGSGFSGVTVVVPEGDRVAFEPFCNANGIILRCYLEMPGKEFIHHELVKCEADLWVPRDTEIVVHLDSDCIFDKKFSLETYFHEGKPILPREHFDDFRHYPSRYSWKRCTDYALGIDARWETMTRHPSLYYVDLYKSMRDRVEAVHHFPFSQFVLYQKSTFPQSFCEFVTMGNHAIQTNFSGVLWDEIKDGFPDLHGRYQIVDFINTPGPYWATPERAAMIGLTVDQILGQPKPLLPDGRGNGGEIDAYWRGIPGWGAKAVWHFGDRQEVRPHPENPLKYYWSHHGVARFREELEQIVS